MFNKNHGLVLLTLLLLLLSVSSVCAADNITDFDNNCLSDVNCSNTLTNNLNNHTLNSNDVIYNEDNDIDCCGAIAFQSVLKENGINITLEESNTAIHSVNGSTSMQGLIDGARKYNLTAYPVRINASDLQPNFIVHMNIDGSNHWCVMSDIVNDSDVSDNNNNNILDIAEFNKYYDNNALLITKESNLNILSATMLSSFECEKIIGNGKLKPVIMVAKKVYNYVKKNWKNFRGKLKLPPIAPIDEVNINRTYHR